MLQLAEDKLIHPRVSFALSCESLKVVGRYAGVWRDPGILIINQLNCSMNFFSSVNRQTVTSAVLNL